MATNRVARLKAEMLAILKKSPLPDELLSPCLWAQCSSRKYISRKFGEKWVLADDIACNIFDLNDTYVANGTFPDFDNLVQAVLNLKESDAHE